MQKQELCRSRVLAVGVQDYFTPRTVLRLQDAFRDGLLRAAADEHDLDGLEHDQEIQTD